VKILTHLETWVYQRQICYHSNNVLYRGADKSLARPGRKQAKVSVRMAWISFGAFPCRRKKNWWQFASRCCSNRACPWHASELVSFLVGLSTYQHPGKLVPLAATRLALPPPSPVLLKTQGQRPKKKKFKTDYTGDSFPFNPHLVWGVFYC